MQSIRNNRALAIRAVGSLQNEGATLPSRGLASAPKQSSPPTLMLEPGRLTVRSFPSERKGNPNPRPTAKYQPDPNRKADKPQPRPRPMYPQHEPENDRKDAVQNWPKLMREVGLKGADQPSDAACEQERREHQRQRSGRPRSGERQGRTRPVNHIAHPGDARRIALRCSAPDG